MNTASVKPYACPECERRFGKEIGLIDHRFNVHDVPKGPALRPKESRRPTLTEVDPVCIECGGRGDLVDGQRIYPHRPDLYAKRFYLCACGAYCGCHPGSVVPLGNPCGPLTRKARSAAHEAFDPLWKRGAMSRQSAYAWLSEATGIIGGRCHIGMMSEAEAKLVVKVVAERQAVAA
jgi:hypothetical protein